MNSLAEGFIEQQPINQALLQSIRLLGEYKGKQELYKQQAPQVLQTLRQVARIQSTESSRRGPDIWAIGPVEAIGHGSNVLV